MKFREEFKWALYCVGLGVTLIVYAEARFSSSETQKKLEEEVREINKEVAKKEDIIRVERKLESIESFLRTRSP